jgi:heme/copper-type cytochrome/quinol oxidase subunit 2
MKENLIILTVIIFLGLLMGAFYYFENIWQNNSTATVQNKTAVKSETLPEPASVEIKLDAKRYFYSPSSITVKKGQRVKITINNIDTDHGIDVPDFRVSGKDSVEFVANKKGLFIFRCIVNCGEGHMEMIGTLTVT